MAKTAIQKVKSEDVSLAKMEDWEIELAAKASTEQATETLGIPRIKHKGAVLKLPSGERVEGNRLPHAVLGYALVKTYYAEEYDQNSSEGQTPDCYAIALPTGPDAEAHMIPHPNVNPEVKQADTCAACPHNRFGTAEKGNGKRCKDTRRVLCLVEVKDKKSIQGAQVVQYSIPAGSLKNWGNYLKGLKEIVASGSVRQVLTELSAEGNENGAYNLVFKPIGKLAKEQALALLEKGKQIEGDLVAPFPSIKREEKQPKRSEKAKAKVK